MATAADVAERYRRLARTMTERIAGVPDDAWSLPTPCDNWDVRALVAHVVEIHGIFQGLVGRSVEHPPVEDDPGGAFAAVRDQMQADLDDPARRAQEYDGYFGRTSFGASVDGFVCMDLVVHGWDLARATGQDETIAPAEVERLAGEVSAMQPTMVETGVIKQPLDPPPGASAQDRLLSALGRRV